MNMADARIAVDEATKRFAALVRSLPNPAMRIRHSDWTIADVAAHVLSFAEAYEGYLQDDADPVVRVHDLNLDNARNLARLDERDIGILTDRLARASAAFLAASNGLDATHPMRWHDVSATVGTVYGIYLGELLIQRRRGSNASAALAHHPNTGRDRLRGHRRGGPLVRRRSRRGSRRRIRGQRSQRSHIQLPLCLRFPDHRSRSGDPPRLHIWGDAVALVLVLYKRRSQWTQIARGRLIAGGRRPWLALSFVDRFGGY